MRVFIKVHLHLCACVCGGKRPTVGVMRGYPLFWGAESLGELELTG